MATTTITRLTGKVAKATTANVMFVNPGIVVAGLPKSVNGVSNLNNVGVFLLGLDSFNKNHEKGD